jgi:hypothetical protein
MEYWSAEVIGSFRRLAHSPFRCPGSFHFSPFTFHLCPLRSTRITAQIFFRRGNIDR